MAFDVRVDEERGVVVAEVIGAIDAQSTVEVVGRAREASKASGLNILYDMRRAITGDMSSGALFWIPRQVPQLQGVAARRTRVALLHLPQYAAMAQYWEDTFRNAGLSARAFTDDEEAGDWLSPTRPAPSA